MAKPKTLEELRAWVSDHAQDGKINGVSTIAEGRSEFRSGMVSGDLYNRALLISAPFGYTKSEIAVIGANRLLANAVIDGAKSGLIVPANCRNGTEFQANLPQGLYEMVRKTKGELGWTNSQMMTMILVYFAHDPGIEKIYRVWVTEFATTNNVTVEEVETAVYDRRRFQARKRRLELSERAGTLIRDKKVAT